MSRNIDADKLIETIGCSADLGGMLGKVVECVKLYAKYMIASAPTVNAWIPCDEQLPTERKRGEWIDRSDGGRILNPWWESYECSVCGSVSHNWNYCPNCGADMRG